MTFVAVYVTCKDEKEAEKIGRILVAERLAGCVNIIPGIKSIYRWQGKIVKDNEALLVAKTTARNKKKIVQAVKKNHSYKVPCINFLPVEIGNANYGRWLAEGMGK